MPGNGPRESYDAKRSEKLNERARIANRLANLSRRGYRLIAPTERIASDEPAAKSSVVPAIDLPAKIVTAAPLVAVGSLAMSPSYTGGHFESALLLGKRGREEATAECQREVPEGGQLPLPCRGM
jgi:hypothetical protein